MFGREQTKYFSWLNKLVKFVASTQNLFAQTTIQLDKSPLSDKHSIIEVLFSGMAYDDQVEIRHRQRLRKNDEWLTIVSLFLHRTVRELGVTVAPGFLSIRN